jgi:hypothetical protein
VNIKITKKVKPMTRISYAMLYPKIDFKENDTIIADDKRGIIKKTGKDITADFSGELITVSHKFADKNWKISQEKLILPQEDITVKKVAKPVQRHDDDDIFIDDNATLAEKELAKLRQGNKIVRDITPYQPKTNIEDVEWGEDGVSLGLEGLKEVMAGLVPRENPMKDLKGLTTPIVQKNNNMSFEDKLKDIFT